MSRSLPTARVGLVLGAVLVVLPLTQSSGSTTADLPTSAAATATSTPAAVPAATTPTTGAPAGFSSVMVKYKTGDRTGGRVSPARLARLTSVGVQVSYERTLPDGTYVLGLPGQQSVGAAWDAIVQRWRQVDPDIGTISPNFPLVTLSEELLNDPLLPTQWNLGTWQPTTAWGALPGQTSAGIMAKAAWDEEWQFNSWGEDAGFAAGPTAKMVRYGSYQGAVWKYKEIAGDFQCNPAQFGGDPAPGITKRCEVSQYWDLLAHEGEYFTVQKNAWIRFGGANNWGYYRHVSDAKFIRCSSDLIRGRDPMPNVTKSCYVQARSDGGGVIAEEGQIFSIADADVPAGRTETTVRYGDVDRWAFVQPSKGTYICNASSLQVQVDPYPNRVKHCEIVKSMGKNQTIGVIDTGAAGVHDLSDKWNDGINIRGNNDDFGDTPGPDAGCNWHGVRVSTVAAATTNNQLDVAGTAPMADLVMARVLDCRAQPTGTVADAIYAIYWLSGMTSPPSVPPSPAKTFRPLETPPIRIINMSFASRIPGCDPLWQAAVDFARARNILIVAAAGNEPRDVDAEPWAPGNCKGVLDVTSTDRSGNRASWAPQGNRIDLSAPGTEISTLSVAPGTSQVIPISANGSSYAAPQVSAVAAMMLGKNPALSVDNLIFRLKNTTNQFPNNSCNKCGTGILDANAALRSAEAIRSESDFPNNGSPDLADVISAPADVAGKTNLVNGRDLDYFLVNLPARQTLTTRFMGPGPGMDCRFFADGISPGWLSCGHPFTNPLSKNVKVWVEVSSTMPDGSPYTVSASWRRTDR